MSDEKKSRRQFLLLGLLTGAAGSAAGQTGADPSDGEKVKMLTPDGQLVEVDKAVLDQISKRKKASNKDILDWRQPPKSS